jgi:hypothetical protein
MADADKVTILNGLWWVPLAASAVLALPALLSLATGQRLFRGFPISASWRAAVVRRRRTAVASVAAWGAAPWCFAAASVPEPRLRVAWATWAAIVSLCFGRLAHLAIVSWAERAITREPNSRLTADGFFPDFPPLRLARVRTLRPTRTTTVLRASRVWLACGLVPIYLLLRVLPQGHPDRRGGVLVAYLGVFGVVWAASWTVFAADRVRARRTGLPTTGKLAAASLGLTLDVAPLGSERRDYSPLLAQSEPGRLTLTAMTGHLGSRFVGLVEERARVRSRHVASYTVRHWVVLCDLPGVNLPAVTIGGRDTFGPSQLAGRGVSVELEEFNRRFHVVHSDAALAHAVLHPRMVEHLIATLPAGSHLTVGGDTAWLWTPGPLTPWNIPAAIVCVTGVADLFPRHVAVEYRAFTDRGGRPVAYDAGA